MIRLAFVIEEQTVMNDAAKPITKRVHVEIDADIHQLMRLQAVTEKKTIRHFLECLIIGYLANLKSGNS